MEMSEDQRAAALHQKVAEAAAVREMCKTQGFELLKKSFKEKIERATRRMLDSSTTDEQVMEIRKKIMIWTEIEGELKHLMLTGDFSARTLRQFEDIDASPTPAGFQGSQPH